MIKDIFKTGLYYIDLDLDVKSISKYCLSLYKETKGIENSNVGGFHSEHLSGEHLPLNDLFIEIEKHGNLYSEEIGFSKNRKLKTIWVNVNSYKDYNAEHLHPNCIMSGVYYTNKPENGGDLILYAPNFDILSTNWSTQNSNTPYTYQQYTTPAVANRLYLFPNWLKHSVEPNLNTKEKRVSISFNLI